jgi:outer membrane protein OmpA-like peptidoglycan-associated protein
MKKIAALALTASIACFTFSTAQAEETPGWYAALGGMYHGSLDGNAHFTPSQNVFEYEPGWGVEGSGGYAFKNGFRLEGEIEHLSSGVDKVTGGTGGSGTLAETDFLLNALYDFHTGTMWTPYIGAGAGLGLIDGDNMGTLSNGAAMNDSQMVFVYQAIAGVSAQITHHWAATADYRYIASTNPRFSTNTGATPTTIDNRSHNFVIGVRYSFDNSEPMIAPAEVNAPMVAPTTAVRAPKLAPVPQSYMVFFDFDRAELTPEAKRIIASAAQDYQKGGYVRVQVTGHTDTSGTNKYNQSLSNRRAAAVKTEFARLGVSSSVVSMKGVGKNGQLVPTADQVREAQNRRAEIVLDKQ